MKEIRFEYCQFKKSSINGIYNKLDITKPFPFDFLKFEKPKSSYLIKNGAEYVVLSWKNKGKEKILHSGLIPLYDYVNIHYGDNINLKGKKDFLLLIANNLGTILYLVKNRKPRNKIQFANDLLASIHQKGCI